ncbi:GM12015 [Drosophila sechellia]|uniref:GM12015 n=1 Tax=Drosophila sechellia TaxID=7238 RepID=B4IJ83_DROSE|nr:GM12015 [Drosophila sechellia]
MSALRRSHGEGRDFLQENKLNVSRMETNGRCIAAANARRVPLWRPVVLHYTEKLRPHAYNVQRRPRQLHGAHESPRLRGGLAQPYGFHNEMRRRMPPNSMWLRFDHTVTRQRAVPQHEGQHGQAVAPHQGQQSETDGQIQPKHGEGDEADRISVCSRMSRASRASQASLASCRSQAKSTQAQENNEPEAPLSARSSASTKTIKSKRSVSQESVCSNATIKSNVTVASRSTNASKRSQVSRKSKLMEVMPPPTHLEDRRPQEREKEKAPTAIEGYTPLTANERQAALQDAHIKYSKLVEEYNRMPVSEPTLRVRNRKIAIERQLDELDYAINMFDQPHMDMYYKK